MIGETVVNSNEISKLYEEIHWKASNSEQTHKNEKKVLLDIMRSMKNIIRAFNRDIEGIDSDVRQDFNIEITQEKEIEDLSSTLRGSDSTLMVFGDSEAGKSTVVNLIVNKFVLPIGGKRIAAPFLELRYNENGRISTSEYFTGSNYVEQNVTLDKYNKQPSNVLQQFFEDNSSDGKTVRVRVEFPLQLLKSGITINEYHYPVDSRKFKRASKKSLILSDMFICVLNQDGITKNIKDILVELIEFGRHSDSILFVITHMENCSSHQQEEQVSRILANLWQINTAFNHKQIIDLNAKRALDVLIQNGTCTDDYSNFMKLFIDFISKIVHFKIERISQELRSLLRNQFATIDCILYKVKSLITDYSRFVTVHRQREIEFENSRKRWAAKFGPVMHLILEDASDIIVALLQTEKFKTDFERATEKILPPTPDTESMNVENTYLCDKFKEITTSIIASSLDKTVSSINNRLGCTFCDDIGLVDVKRRRLLKKLENIGGDIILEHFKENITKLLENIKLRTNQTFYIDRPDVPDEWKNYRSSEAKKFLDKLLKTLLKNFAVFLCFKQNVSATIDAFQEALRLSYMVSSQKIIDKSIRLDESKKLLVILNSFRKSLIIQRRSKLNPMHLSKNIEWSLSANVLENMESIRKPAINFSEYYIPVMRATLKTESIPNGTRVQVNRLSGNFCAEDVRCRAHLNEFHTEKNILCCYGAYCKGNDVFLVTEPWEYTLTLALNYAMDLAEETRLQIAIDLVDTCMRHIEIIPIEQLHPNALLITKDRTIKLNIVGHPVSPELCDEEQKESEIINALGITFVELLKPIRPECPFINSLCTFDEMSGVLLCNQFTLAKILELLKHMKAELKLRTANFPRELLNSRKPVGLIAIDGGGTRGVIAARIVQEIQRVAGRPLWEIFQYGAGTSTGGLLILSTLVRRSDPTEVVEIYKRLPAKIFPPRLIPTSPYPSEPLEAQLKEHFGDTRMIRTDDNAPYAFVVAKENHEPDPFLLRNYDVPNISDFFPGASNWLCAEAARATTAAPTFFDPYVRDGDHYFDGAMGYDNPVMLLFHEFLALSDARGANGLRNSFGTSKIDYIVSIGTGIMESPPKAPGRPKRGIRHAFNIAMIGLEWLADSETAHYHVRQLSKAFGNIPYFRFNPVLPRRVPLDTVSEQDINEFVELTEAYLNDIESGIPEMLRKLSDLIDNLV